jgi:hypothetical protein
VNRNPRNLQRAVPYHLAFERTVVAGNASVTLTAQVPGDADFEARYVNASATSVTATLLFRDSGTRLELMNRPTMLALVTGIGQQPYVLPQPALFVKNSNIELVITDLSGQNNTIQVVFCGYLLYPAPVNQM